MGPVAPGRRREGMGMTRSRRWAVIAWVTFWGAILLAGSIAQYTFPAQAQTAYAVKPTHYLSAGTLNPTLVKAGRSVLWTVVAVNTTTAPYYLKFYDKATAPTCGTDTPVLNFPIPFWASNAGGGAVIPVPVGWEFTLGLGFCLTGAIADNDTTNAAAGVSINL